MNALVARFALAVSVVLYLEGPSMASDQAARQAAEELLDSGMGFGQEMLAKHGGFHPYGFLMMPSGRVDQVATYAGNEHPTPDEVIGELLTVFKRGAEEKEYIATAVFYDATITLPDTDRRSTAIAVAIDHFAGFSIVFYSPYKRSGDLIEFGESFAVEGSYDIFGRSQR